MKEKTTKQVNENRKRNSFVVAAQGEKNAANVKRKTLVLKTEKPARTNIKRGKAAMGTPMDGTPFEQAEVSPKRKTVKAVMSQPKQTQRAQSQEVSPRNERGHKAGQAPQTITPANEREKQKSQDHFPRRRGRDREKYDGV